MLFISVRLLPHLCVCYHPVEDSVGTDTSPPRPQDYLLDCELKAHKDDQGKMDNDENEQSSRAVGQALVLRVNQLHVTESEAVSYEGGPVTGTPATREMSLQHTVSLGGFEIMPTMVSWWKCGSGPVHLPGQHLAAVEEEEESEEEEEEEDVNLLRMSGKCSALEVVVRFHRRQ